MAALTNHNLTLTDQTQYRNKNLSAAAAGTVCLSCIRFQGDKGVWLHTATVNFWSLVQNSHLLISTYVSFGGKFESNLHTYRFEGVKFWQANWWCCSVAALRSPAVYEEGCVLPGVMSLVHLPVHTSHDIIWHHMINLTTETSPLALTAWTPAGVWHWAWP